MRQARCLVFAVLAGLPLAACAEKPKLPAIYTSLASNVNEVDAAAARDLINAHRKLSALAPLMVDDDLMAAAKAHARAMAAAGRVGGDVGNGGLSARLAAHGVTAGVRSENVSAGYHTLADAMSGWRGSEPHNKTMLLPEGTRMGIASAYAPGSKYSVFWSLIVTD